MAEYIDKSIAIQICVDSWDTGDASQDIKDEVVFLPNDYTYEFGEVERVVIKGSDGVI